MWESKEMFWDILIQLCFGDQYPAGAVIVLLQQQEQQDTDHTEILIDQQMWE